MKRLFGIFFCIVLLCSFSFSQEASTNDYLVQGLDSYKIANWDSAILSFKKALSISTTNTPEVLYMLVMSEMFAQKYEDALSDCESFKTIYPESQYSKYIEYQKGRALFFLEKYTDSLSVFKNFCSKNERDDLYSAALFWSAESYYATFDFDSAKKLYQLILNDFPTSSKFTESVYRLDLIIQRENEEKLLYLLKVTGEEYLSAKQKYEKKIKRYETEESINVRNQLKISKDNEKKLQSQLDELKRENELTQLRLAELQDKYNEQNELNSMSRKEKYLKDLQELKMKANQVQKAISEDKTDDNGDTEETGETE